MPKYWVLGAALAAAIGWSFAATADDVTIPDEYAKLIQQRSRIAALDDGYFGDHVSLSTGSLEFVQTDVLLPGNDSLEVRAGRRLELGSDHGAGHFGSWDLDIPHLHGIFPAPLAVNNWMPGMGSAQRCSQYDQPPGVPSTGGTGGWFDPDDYWHGTFLYLPDGGDQELLLAPGGAGDMPADGNAYPVSTLGGAVGRCKASLASTSEAGSVGEGFEIVTPDGTTYIFDQMVSRIADNLTKSEAGTVYRLPRVETILYPTQVIDRFGNTVTYTWSSSNPWRLLQISASDGRHLDFTYSSTDPASYLVQSVSDGTRIWTYTNGGQTVTQPDGGVWTNTLDYLAAYAKPSPTTGSCDTMSSAGGSWTGTITAPSGATATYHVAATIFGRSQVVRGCATDASGTQEYATEPYLFASVALMSKTITGPGLPSGGLTWSYAYGAPNNCWIPSSVPANDTDAVLCTSSSLETHATTVTTPDGAVSRYTFGNRYLKPEGTLYTEEHGISGATALYTKAITYGDVDAAPYAAHGGTSPRGRGDYLAAGRQRPRKSVVVTQQGQTFTWNVPLCGSVYCFDTRARATTVTRSGPSAALRTETTVYDDDTVHWVLGQVSRRTIDGMVASQTTFDANRLPWKTYAFGKLKNIFTYNADGTLATAADGNGNLTAYSSWKRGIPQSVHFPATTESPSGATRTAVVSDEGWIASVTDENGYATGYAYDPMGRITQVTYPAGDSVAWAPTISAFAPIGVAEYGIAAGHWKQTVNTGNAYKVTLFDALWRPVLVREYDAANVAGTDHYVATAYDNAGRVVDASYPLGTAPTMTTAATWLLGGARPSGVRTGYDALGRPTTVQQDSELGVLATTTEYLTGFQRRVTDARGHATTEQFMAWDTPTYDWPVRIDAPESQVTLIGRDTFGKPTTITRGAGL